MPDRSLLITGGTGALGSAVVDAFLAAGWRAVVTWIAPRERERLQERPGLELVEADLFDPDAAARAAAIAAGRSDAPLRALANLVGGYESPGRVHQTPYERFQRQLELNLRPTYLATQSALPHLIESGGGGIVCVSARAALRPFAGAAGYITAKAAVLGFVGAVDAEYRDQDVRCNAVLPSVIDTPANRAAQPDADHSKWVDPAEVASVIRFLCSDESSVVSGASVPVYGRA